ncbi:MAG: CPBP family intramembrane metalloprotease [Planctomycetales bacterium]|nr:CPBP family intramembrane metalloprotease [Planctomycetales bacterium]
MHTRVTADRMLRLCLKELRESLRDRRTIVTLVLMPLLVYPLLSLILNRVILNNGVRRSEPTLTIGIGSQINEENLDFYLRYGYALLQDPYTAPLFLNSSATTSDDIKIPAEGAGHKLLNVQSVPVVSDGRHELENGIVDLVIVKQLEGVQLPPPSNTNSGAQGNSPTPSSGDSPQNIVQPGTGSAQREQSSVTASSNEPQTSPSGTDTSQPSDDEASIPKDSEATGTDDSIKSSLAQETAPSSSNSTSASSSQANNQGGAGSLGSSDNTTGANNGQGTSGLRPRRRRWQVPSPNPEDPSIFIRTMGVYEVRYRVGDLQSERALQLLERMLTAVNNQVISGLSRGELAPSFALRATPIAIKNSYSDLLSTMIPLVLVLMTMAGAVYPAIDLTAGERERGTMEALIVSPIPSAYLLLAKYSAVVVVALLTALANLAAMSITLWVSGLGKLILGTEALSLGMIGTVLVLLVLFTMFFAALLLAVTSFAKSFKEAQAYLIPLMLLALAPGVMSLLPGIEFNSILATAPLINIVLLAREVLTGGADWNPALVAVLCNGVYAMAALVLASRLFGNDASIQGSQGSWRDLISRPNRELKLPEIEHAALTMAVMFPLYFVLSSLLPWIPGTFTQRLWASAAVSVGLLLLLPIVICWLRRIRLASTLKMRFPTAKQWLLWLPGICLIASSAWMLAHEIIILGQSVGIGTISDNQMDQVREFRHQLSQISIVVVLITLAISPAVCEEFLFRGFVLSSLHRRRPMTAVIYSAIIFGLMHVLTSNVLAVERFLPTTYLGLIIGWIAYRTASIWPGMLLHASHNGLLLLMSVYQDWLKEHGVLVEDSSHLPLTWLAGGVVCLIVGLLWFAWFTKPVGVTTEEDDN